MSEIEITLSEEQYKVLLRFLYFADFCVTTGLNSDFKATDDRNILFNVLDKLYKQGDSLGYPESLSLTSITSVVRFSEEESISRMNQVENDLVNAGWIMLAKEFAKRDLKKVLLKPGNVGTLHIETYDEINDRWINQASKKYLHEFKNNGISNLRFKMFYKVPENEGEE